MGGGGQGHPRGRGEGLTVAHSWHQVSRMLWGGWGEGQRERGRGRESEFNRKGTKEPQVLCLSAFHL